MGQSGDPLATHRPRPQAPGDATSDRRSEAPTDDPVTETVVLPTSALPPAPSDAPTPLEPTWDSGIAARRRQVRTDTELAEELRVVDTERRYDTVGVVGRGGMSTVHRASDATLLREVAIKRLRDDLCGEPETMQRFVEEARITGQLDHPNIVPVHELARDADGGIFFSMKLVEGSTLEQVLDRAGEERLAPATLREHLQIFLKICEAVAFAHSRGVLHRDLKPSNIMVGDYGQVYIMDWGVARLMASPSVEAPKVHLGSAERREIDLPGSVIGTPSYMAPEQVEGEHDRIDEQTDVFALGATLYHLLTGHPPYRAQDYYAQVLEALHCQPTPAEELAGPGRIPPPLAEIVGRAMAPEPENRHASVAELRGEVEAFLLGSWHLPTEAFEAGAVIVREGEPGDAAYILESGHCVVEKTVDGTVRELRRLGPGDVFGETAVFSSAPRTATVRALDRVTVMIVTRDTLTSGLALDGWLGRFVVALADRFREVDERLRQLEG